MNRWTPEEDAIVHRMYARYAPHLIARNIKRTTNRTRTPIAIRNRAATLGIANRDIQHGYVRLIDAHDRSAGFHTGASVTIIRAATRAGVIKRANHVHGRPFIAPIAWVDAWLEQHYSAELPAQEAAEVDVLDWVSTRDVATQLGIDPAHAADKLLRQRGWLRKAAGGMRRVRLMHQRGRPLYWHPEDVEKLVRSHRERLESPKTGWRPARGLGHPGNIPSARKPHPAARQAA